MTFDLYTASSKTTLLAWTSRRRQSRGAGIAVAYLTCSSKSSATLLYFLISSVSFRCFQLVSASNLLAHHPSNAVVFQLY
jgi:hypothetical protein